MVSEPNMANTSNHTTNNNNLYPNPSTYMNFSFINSIKLDRSNYRNWRTQVLASIRGNRLEDHITGAGILEKFITVTSADRSIIRFENPAYTTWRSHDHILI